MSVPFRVDQFLPKVLDLYKLEFDLQEAQKEVIVNLLNGHHTLTELHTGFGKSITYTLPPLLLNEVTVFISFSRCISIK